MFSPKMSLMARSNLNLYNTNFLLTTIYEYVQENRTTYARGLPLKQEWERTFELMTHVQDFLLLEILDTKKGLGGNLQLRELVTGSLCDSVQVSDESLIAFCKTMGGGVVQRGIVGLNSYTLASVKEVKDYFDNSAKTYEDMYIALNFGGLINIEIFYLFTYEAYKRIDFLIREELAKDFDSFRFRVKEIVAIYILIYVVFGVVASRKIKNRLEKEITDWRKIIRQIPYSVVNESKLLKSYLSKINKYTPQG